MDLKWILLLLVIAACNGLYTKNDGVFELTDANFDSKVLKSDRIWVVEFYAPYCGHCKNLVPEFKKAAKLLKGIVAVGAVDSTVHQKISSKFAIKGYPTIKIFSADGKSTPSDYNGPRTAKGIAEAVKKEIAKTLEGRNGRKNEKKDKKKEKKDGKAGEVVILTDSNFEKLVLNSKDAWMVEFFAPWCGHCQKLEPEWKKAAKMLGGRVKFGALDATAHESMARKYNIQGFPTIRFFAPGTSEAEEYQGGRTASDLAAFAEKKYETLAPPPEVVEATGTSVALETCRNKQLCIISILPNIYDCQADCRNEKIKTINEAIGMFKSRPWGWLWVEGGVQKDLEEAFGLSDAGWPLVVAMSPNKLKYATHFGAFSAGSIKEFLNSVNYGKARVLSIPEDKLDKKFLKLVDTTPWNGKDKTLPVVEEIDISDVKLEL